MFRNHPFISLYRTDQGGEQQPQSTWKVRTHSLIYGPPRWPGGRASASKVADLGLNPRFTCGAFSRSSYASHFKCVTPVATLPGAWSYRFGPVSVYWDWVRQKVGLQLLSQCSSTHSYLCRSVPEIRWHVAWTFSSQPPPASHLRYESQ